MQYETFLPTEYTTDPEKRKEVLHIVSELPVNQRLALVACFYGGLSVQETATAMNAPLWITAKYLDDACAKVLRGLGMENLNITGKTNNVSVLKQIFDWHEAETITDEMTQRVLEPVLKMIQEGKFERSPWHRYSWLVRPVIAVVTVAALIVTVAVTQGGGGITAQGIVVSDPDVPLVAMSVENNILCGKVCLEDKGISGIEIVLIDAEDNKVVHTAISNDDGTYSLDGIPSGTYKLRVLLPEGMALVEEDADGNVVLNQRSELTFGADTPNARERVDIHVWLMD